MNNNATQTERCLYVTTDYDSLKHITGNRAINPQNVEKIKKSMSEKQLIVAAVVNEDMQIIDGQHRHEACKQLNLPFYYYIVEGYTLPDVQRMNTNMKNWSLPDFMDTYLDLYKAGHSEYKGYKELSLFMEHYSISLQAALFLANTRSSKGDYEETFKHGGFVFSDKNTAALIAEEMRELFQGFDEKIWKTITFTVQYTKLFVYENYNYDIMIRKTQALATGTKESVPFNKLSGGSVILNGLISAYNHSTAQKLRLVSSDVDYHFSKTYQKGK